MTSNNPANPLCVVVVTYNSGSVLPGLLDSLAAGLAGAEPFEVVVVDNDSRDRSVEIARAHPIAARVIATGTNAGYSAGINAAVRTLGPDADVLILNPDIRLLPGSVRVLRERMAADPMIGVAVPRNFYDDGRTDRTLRREPSLVTAWSDALLGGNLAARLGLGEIVDDGKAYDRAGTIEWATGSALLVSARARQAVGEWDESFFLYSEEVEFQRRVRTMGFKITYVPQAKVVHIGGDYQTNTRLFALLTANRIRYYRRNHGAAATALFRLGVALGEGMRAARGATHRAGLWSALAPLRPALDYRTERPAA